TRWPRSRACRCTGPRRRRYGSARWTATATATSPPRSSWARASSSAGSTPTATGSSAWRRRCGRRPGGDALSPLSPEAKAWGDEGAAADLQGISAGAHLLRSVTMRSRAQIKGHPLHPILIAFPVAFTVGALVLDLAGWLAGWPTVWTAG